MQAAGFAEAHRPAQDGGAGEVGFAGFQTRWLRRAVGVPSDRIRQGRCGSRVASVGICISLTFERFRADRAGSPRDQTGDHGQEHIAAGVKPPRSRTRLRVCRLNEEKVVKPPQIPIMRK